MINHKGMGVLLATFTLGMATAALAQDPFPEPSTAAQPGSVAEEAEIGTIEAREDDLGVARDDPEQDMQGTATRDEPISGDGTGAESGQDGSERQGESNEFDSPYRDLEPEDPGLEEPRQPIRPGQMEEEQDSPADD
ncbi:MAG: hypothetical protein JJU25_08490 [Halomonas sp.]|nr:hypothetical protein [Halomonas sp.]MCC5882659.1 hypothetical protein [Halomonas sp.]